MSRNGSGTYSLPQPAFTPGTTIASSAVNSDFSDIAAALTQSISKDGQTVYTGNQPMGGNKLTGLGAGSAPADSVNVGQIVAGGLTYAAGSGTDTIVIAPTPGITAYGVGQIFSFKAAATNTGAVTLNVSTVGAGPVKWPDGTALAAGDIIADGIAEVEVADITTPTAPVFHLLNSSKPTLARTGGTMTGTLTMSGAAVNAAKGADIASATTSNIGAMTGNYGDVTGTTTITGLGTVQAGTQRTVNFTGILTLTHNGTSLILPTAANITTAAGDVATFVSLGSGNWKCTGYQRASGAALSVVAVQQYAQAYCTVSGGVLTEQKMTGFTSVVRDSTGLFTCTLSTAMPDANYVVEFTCGSTTALTLNRYCGEDLTSARSTTVFHLYVGGDNVGQQDPASLNIRVFA